MRTPPDTFELLRRAVLGEIDRRAVGAVVSRHGWPATVRAACWHGVENHLHLALRLLETGEIDLAPLESLYRRSVAGHLRALADLARIGPRLEAAGIPAVVVKGPILAELYPRPDLRAYSDLDLIVPRARFGAAVAVIEADGGRLLDRNWGVIRSEARTQVHLAAANGTAIDLHWHLLNRGIARRGLTIEMEQVFDRRLRTGAIGVECATLDPVDTALHAAVHASLSGGARLSQVADVRVALRAPGLDWELLAARARAWNAGEIVAIMAARAARLLDLPAAPAGFTQALATRRSWSAIVTAVEPRLRPELRSEYGPIARMTRAARPGRGRSAVTAASWLGFQTRGWLTRRLPAAIRPADSSAEAAREAYFAAVAKPEVPGWQRG